MRILFPPNPIKTPALFNSILRLRFNSLRSHCFNSMAIPPPKSAMASAVDNEVGLARRFWIKFHRESVFAMYTPFSLSLASGNLKIETFRHYIAQDVHFLKAFAHAWVVAFFNFIFFFLYTSFFGYIFLLGFLGLFGCWENAVIESESESESGVCLFFLITASVWANKD